MASRRRSSRFERGKSQEEAVRLLLTLIVDHAERQRVAAKRGPRSRTSRDIPHDHQEPPLSLIELIQASTAVFERYGIGSPDDAVYHRYLLKLSINPEPDWRLKLARFQLADQPRVRRLCGVKTAVAAQLEAQGARSSRLKASTSTREEVETSRRHDRPRGDLFGDVLARRGAVDGSRGYTKEQSTRESTRPASPTRRSAPRTSQARSSDGDASPMARQVTMDRLLALQRPGSTKLKPSRRELDYNMDNLDIHDSQDYASDYDRRTTEFKAAVSNSQLLSTVFEQWKASVHLRKLNDIHKHQDVHIQRALMSTTAVAAIFHWIVYTLPEKYTVSSHTMHRELYIPSTLARRINVTERSSVRSLSTLNQFARRLVESRVRDLVSLWRRRAATTIQLRRKWLSRQQSETTETAFQCILNWRLITEQHKLLVERANWVSQRQSRRLQRDTITHWRLLYRQRRQEASTLDTCAAKRAVYTWKRYTQVKRLVRDQLLAADGHNRYQLLVQGWKSLKKYLVTQQTRRGIVKRSQEAQARRWKRAVLREWRLVMEAKYQTDKLVTKFVTWRRRRLVRRWFAIWTDSVYKRLVVTDKLQAAELRRRTRLLTTVIYDWKLYYNTEKRLDLEREKKLQTNSRRRIWRRWRRLAAIRIVVLTILRDYASYLLAHCWRVLVLHMERQRAKKKAARRFLQHRQVTCAHYAFHRWYTALNISRRRRTLEDQVRVTVRQGTLLRSMWNIWRKSFRLVRLGQLAAQNLDTYRKQHVLRVWRTVVERKKTGRTLYTQVIQRMGMSRTTSSFYDWKEYVSKTRTRKESVHIVALLTSKNWTRRYWMIWRAVYSKTLLQGQQVMKAVLKWKTKRLNSSFQYWKTRWSLRKRHHLILHKLKVQSTEKVVEIHFQAWKKTSKASIKAKLDLTMAKTQLEKWKLVRVLHKWRGRLAVKRVKGSQLQAALAHWQQLGLAAPFRRWVAYTKSQKIQKTQIAVVATFFSSGLVRTYFSSWKKWIRAEKWTAIRLQNAQVQIQRILVRRCVGILRSSARTRRSYRHICSQIARSSASGALRQSLTAWKRFTTSRRSQQAQQATYIQKIERYKLWICVQKWEKRTRVRKLLQSTILQAVHKSKSTLLERCIHSWRAYTTQKTLRQALQHKALVFQVLNLLPVYFRGWKRFVYHQRRSKSLVLCASRFLCHQLEHKAFAAWVEHRKTKIKSLQVITRWQQAAVSRCYTLWMLFTIRQKTLKSTHKLVVNSCTLLRTRCTLRHWHQTARTRRILRILSSRQAGRVTAEVLGRWRRYTHYQRSARILVRKIQSQTLVRVFNSWKYRVSLQVDRIQSIRTRFATLWLSSLHTHCWSNWRRFTTTRRLLRVLLQGRQAELLSGVLKSWYDESRRQKRYRQSALVVQSTAKLQVQREFWSQWRVQLTLSTSVRVLQGQVTRQRSIDSVRRRFRRWLTFTRVCQQVHKLQRRVQLCLLRGVFFDGFRAYTRAKRQQRAMALHLQDVHRAYLRVWLVDQVHDRIAIVSASELMEQEGACRRRLAQMWTAWLAFHIQKTASRAQTRDLRRRLTGLGESRVSRVQRMILRWYHLQLARALRLLRIQVYTRRQERRNVLVAMDWWLSTMYTRVFQGWKRVYTSQKKTRIVHALYVRVMTKRRLTTWRVWLQRRRKEKTLYAKARALYIHSATAAVYTCWKAWASRRSRQRQLVLHVYRASCIRYLGELVVAWRDYTLHTKTKRVQSTLARVLHHERLLRKSWRDWKERVGRFKALRQQLQANTERLHVLVLCSSFRAWYTWSQQRRKLSKMMATLSVKCDFKTSRRVFTTWYTYTDHRVKLRCLADTFYRFRRCHKGVEALKTVCIQSQRRSLLLEKAKLFTAVLQGSQQTSIFIRWKTYSKLAHKTRVVTLQYLQGKLLPACWRAWVAVTRRRRSLTATARRIAATWSNIAVRRAWNALVVFHSHRQARRQQLLQGETHFNTRQLRSAVRYWRSTTTWEKSLASVCRGAVVRWQMTTASRCLMAIQRYTSYQRQLKTTASIVRSRSRQTATLTAWYTWRKLLLVLQAGRRRRIAFYWHKWAVWRLNKQSLSVLHARIQGVYLKITQRQALTSWKWYVARSQANKAQMKVVVARILSRLVYSAFHSLVVYQEYRRRRRADTIRAEGVYSRQVVTRTLRAWRVFVSTLGSQRERLRSYVNVLQHVMQGKSFRSWAAYTLHRRELRKKMARSLAIRSQLCIQTLFFEWRRVITKAKWNQRATEFHRILTIRYTLKHWRQFVVLNKVERMLGTSTKRTLEHSFIVWRRRVTTTRIVREFQLKKQREYQVYVLTTCYTVWRHWTSVRVRCRCILSRIAAGSRLRLRFDLWKAFSAHRRRLGSLLLDSVAYKNQDQDQSVDSVLSLRAQLQVKARNLHRFDLTWDLHSVWRYWRLAFHSALFHRLRTLQRSVYTWKQYTIHQKRARLVIAALTTSRQRCIARRVLKGWYNVVRVVKQLQADRQRERQLWTIVNTEMLRRHRRFVQTHFAAWKALVQAEKHLKSSADAYYRARVVTRVWLTWRHDYRELVAVARRRRRGLERILRHYTLSRAVKALGRHRMSRKRVRLAVEYCLNKRSDKLMDKILAGWRNYTRRQRIAEVYSEYVERERLKRLLSGWKTVVDQRRRHRLILHLVYTQRAEQVYTRVWRLWSGLAHSKRQSRVYTTRAVAFRVRWLLHSRWMTRVRTDNCYRRRSELVTRRMYEFRRRRAVDKWRAVVTHGRLRRLYRTFVQRTFLRRWHTNAKFKLATRFHESTRRLQAKRMLLHWRFTARRLGHWRLLGLSMATMRRSSTLQRVWCQWLAVVDAHRRTRLAMAFHSRRLMTHGLYTWVDAVRILVDEREARLFTAVKSLELGVARRVVLHWRSIVQRHKQRRFVVLACVLKLDGLCQQRVVRAVVAAWRWRTRLVRACRWLQVARRERVGRDVVQKWTLYVKKRREKREKQAEASRYFRERLVSVSFFYWQTYTLAWREVHTETCILPSEVSRSGLGRVAVGEGRVRVYEGQDKVDSEESERRRRPMSPVMKRLGKKKKKKEEETAVSKTHSERKRADLEGGDDDEEGSSGEAASVTPTLGDAAELTVGVNKRLQVLGPWQSR